MIIRLTEEESGAVLINTDWIQYVYTNELGRAVVCVRANEKTIPIIVTESIDEVYRTIQKGS